MDQITITIPDPTTKAFVDQVVSAGEYPSVNDYLLKLIREDQQRRRKVELEALLLEGMESELTPLTDADWDDMRRRYDERHPETGTR
jgi:Arc/MetJ-type ribon-helix-helix transcriptional regulator